MLVFDHVDFYYKKDQPILHNMSFTIQPGEFVAIVGANGCGKSTIARLMNGLLLPNQGQVRYHDWVTLNPKDTHSIHEKIGYIFQSPEDQFITTTVLDEVLFGLENIRVARQDMQSRVVHALQAVDMLDYAQAMPHQLSGGQMQRVAIAAIIAMRPEVIIFDEATSMLDPQAREQVLSIMRDLHLQGMTIIHVTHHMDEVLSAQRVILIDQGRIAYDGDAVDFFDTVQVSDYQLTAPFAVRLHHKLELIRPVRADWKEMIRSKWPTN
ncbi:energy-coupling factor transport system ATP-binding protein [Paenibacillus shirakamiensis]|uniref:Energy-coupling factor transport system ATP-binding protein n=1 Tax=Paenibacillus shirakamiensis TaxID=1265935 RepID=A0ABS4JDV7_9BACL|nr:ATP-binding cassette domain-containing protein [Paenibacillus shirakamiensis]MBP1999908.1 energy-coupling factor transport system ATP-binding protein [Paenibacillus shirakamiensis]